MAVNYEIVKDYESAVDVYNVNLKEREVLYNNVVLHDDIKDIDENYIYFNNEDELPIELYKDVDTISATTKDNIKKYIDTFADEKIYKCLVYKYDEEESHLFDLTSCSDINDCNSYKDFKPSNYLEYLALLDTEELKRECKKNYYMADFLEYRYELLKAYIKLDIIQPCKRYFNDERSLILAIKSLDCKNNIENIVSLNNSILNIIDSVNDSLNNVSMIKVIDKDEPIIYRDDIKKYVIEFAYKALKFYYRLNALSNRMSWESGFNCLVLNEPIISYEELLDKFSFKVLDDCFGVKKNGAEYDLEARLRGMANLEYAFETIDDDIYDV